VNITCIHCDNEFSITVDQLGTRGKCPHCKATIRLPKAVSAVPQTGELSAPTPWFENSLSGIGTVILHLLIILILALVPWGDLYEGDWGDGEDVMIGQVPRQTLIDNSDEQLNAEPHEKMKADSLEMMNNEVQPPSAADDLAEIQLDVNLLAPSGGISEAMDIKAFSKPKIDASGSEDFGEMISRLKRDGLDIVITFDSTGSMSSEISQVKNKIERMGSVLFQLVPKTRISICTYRDTGEDYVVKGLRLTDNLSKVREFLDGIRASGGGDEPEAVDAGLEWSIEQNKFRRNARKIILIFGDAPPHKNKKNRTLQLASEFRRKHRGVISTVTCHKKKRLGEFVEIAQMGGGEAFLSQDEREIMTQLMILVFGSRHRDKVLKAFDLMDQ
jgi:Mg-chelatase subunit ChlD